MIIQKFYDYASFEQYYSNAQSTARRAFEKELIEQHADQESFKWSGICKGCDAHSLFLIDKQYSIDAEQGWQPNWRERVLCQCHLNNRQRAIIHAIKDTIHLRLQSSDEPLALHIKFFLKRESQTNVCSAAMVLPLGISSFKQLGSYFSLQFLSL